MGGTEAGERGQGGRSREPREVGEGRQGAGSMLGPSAFRRGRAGRGLQVEYRSQGNNTKGENGIGGGEKWKDSE